MSESIKHECGIAMIRLLQPLEYYREKYGSSLWGVDKLYLLMEKQHNRGQEGAGAASVKLNAQPGEEYIFRYRSTGAGAIQEVFTDIREAIAGYRKRFPASTSGEWPFAGNIYMGHLRYSTTGHSGISYVHPFLRRNNWRNRNLLLAGNFNLTNVNEVLAHIVAQGQHPRHNADTFIILEQLGSLLDSEADKYYRRFTAAGLSGQALNDAIDNEIRLEDILRKASSLWDGGYVIGGVTGSGDMFAFRDGHGIRPAFYYKDDEIVAVASERPVIQTAFDLKTDDVKELLPGQSIIVKRNGRITLSQILPAKEIKACSFERIYFSRGSDRDIYRERKKLGYLLTHDILKKIDHDLENTVFSFIPNTAEVAYYGMMQGMEEYLNHRKSELICSGKESLSCGQIRDILSKEVRTEKLAVKDIKLRTFITENSSRNDLAAHVYDITYGTVREGSDSIVVIDDSIVRGTTLRQSIIEILSRLSPRHIVIVSSSPQIRYPDFYGIDMSNMKEFIAFNAAIELLRERGMGAVIDGVYAKCKAQQHEPKEQMVNHVKAIYASFTDEEISDKIARMITPEDCPSRVSVVYQTIGNLHKACPDHTGDWYFSGDYPTPGGNRMINQAFIAYYEGLD